KPAAIGRPADLYVPYGNAVGHDASFGTAESRNDKEAGALVRLPYECNCASIGRPRRADPPGRTLSQAQQPLGSERFHVQIELMPRIGSLVPGESDLAPIGGKRRRDLLPGQAREGNDLPAKD